MNGSFLLPAELLPALGAVSLAGYDVMEVPVPMLEGFMAHGKSLGDLAAELRRVSVQIHSIDCVDNIEIPDGRERQDLLTFCRRMCGIAQAIECPNIQVVSGSAFAGSSWPRIRDETVRGIQEIADIAAEHGLTLAYEPLAWTPVKTLEQGLEVIDLADRPNIGLLIDTFMVFAGGGELDTIRRMDANNIPTVHLGDTAPRAVQTWSDDDRYPMPGEGIVPLGEIVQAVFDTGYDGVVTDEISPKRYEKTDRLNLAKAIKSKGDAVLAALRPHDMKGQQKWAEP